MTAHIVEPIHVVEKVNKELLNCATYGLHRERGTLDQYYHEIITNVAVDMITLSIQRQIEGLEPLSNTQEVFTTLETVADTVCLVFGKPLSQVQDDLMKTVDRFSASDLQSATILRHKNLLN